MSLRVVTVYGGFMGECNTHGIGAPCTFIRLSGCNLQCYKTTLGKCCDTPEALSGKSGTVVTEDYIITLVEKLGNKVICLTGGEPLLQDIHDLVERLAVRDYHCVIETNGTQDIRRYRGIRNVSFVVDKKGDSTGEKSKFFFDNLSLMNEKDYLKFVIFSNKDYDEMRNFVAGYSGKGTFNVSVGLFWGDSRIGYQELCKKLQGDRLNVSVNMQTHKMMVLFDANKKNVSNLEIPKTL